MKKAYSLLLALLLTGAGTTMAQELTAPVPAFDKDGNAINIDMMYEVISESDKTCRIGYEDFAVIEKGFDGSLHIPSTINGYKVIEIGTYAFERCSNCRILSLPEELESIGHGAFRQGPSLRSLKLPQGLKYIGGVAFSETDIDTLIIPKSVTDLGHGIAEGCNDLVCIRVEEGNTKYNSPEGSNVIIKTKDNAIMQGCIKSTIPSTTESIEYDAFCKLNGLKSIYIPSSVTELGDYAFRESGLTKVVIPSSVTRIGHYAFVDCDDLERVDIMGNVTLGTNVFDYFYKGKKPSPVNTLYYHGIELPDIQTGSDDTFHNMSNTTLYVSPSLLDQFKQNEAYSVFKSVEAYKVVDRIDITDYEWPEHGANADFTVTSPTEGVDSVMVQYEMYKKILDPSPCVANETYNIAMQIFLKEGYVFADYPESYIGDKKHDMRIIRTEQGWQRFAWTYTVPVPEDGIPITGVNIGLATKEPVVGEAPSTTITDPTARAWLNLKYEHGTVTWTPADATFEKGKTYTVSIPLTTGGNYTFAPDFAPTINGKAAYITDRTYNGKYCQSLTINYTWHQVKSVTVGDVNSDGSLNTADVTAIYTYIIDGDASSFKRDSADVNNDNNVNTADVTAVYSNIISGAPRVFTIDGVSFKMMPVEAGKFMMGAPEDDTKAQEAEQPQHEVTLTKSYSMAETETTQKLWNVIMGNNPSNNTSSFNNPVEQVTWDEIQDFCAKLNYILADQIGDKVFRLPTEAEWEYAARGGNKSQGYKYSGGDDPNEVAWYTSNSEERTHEVATKKPNELGLYDMNGNIWERCYDYKRIYSETPQTDPIGPITPSSVLLRGGSFYNGSMLMRLSYRSTSGDKDAKSKYQGFRLVLAAPIAE